MALDLSILYLRCVAVGLGALAEELFPFNSLFEMRKCTSPVAIRGTPRPFQFSI